MDAPQHFPQEVFPAFLMLDGSGLGAYHKQDRILDAVLLKDPHTDTNLMCFIQVIYGT
jgi:hypothetical protein